MIIINLVLWKILWVYRINFTTYFPLEGEFKGV